LDQPVPGLAGAVPLNRQTLLHEQGPASGDGAMMQFLTGGADLTAIALFINRIALGAFSTTSGFHKLFNRERHAVFVRELVSDRVPRLGFNQWFVPSIESFGGLA
jgi:hypothetical protein